MKNRDALRTGNIDESQTTTLKKWKSAQEISENKGDHPEECKGVLDGPAEQKLAGFRQSNSVLRAIKKNPHNKRLVLGEEHRPRGGHRTPRSEYLQAKYLVLYCNGNFRTYEEQSYGISYRKKREVRGLPVVD